MTAEYKIGAWKTGDVCKGAVTLCFIPLGSKKVDMHKLGSLVGLALRARGVGKGIKVEGRPERKAFHMPGIGAQ